MLVVDASALAPALLDDGNRGEELRARLRHEQIAAPELIDLEVTAVLRRQVRIGAVGLERAKDALADLRDASLRRVSHAALLGRCWELRDNLTCYDASYVALAEALNVTLITADRRLARAPDRRCPVEVL